MCFTDPILSYLYTQHAEKLAYLARRLHVLDQERTALTTALDLLCEGSEAIKDEKMDVDSKQISSAGAAHSGVAEEEKSSYGEDTAARQKRQDELLQACLCPLYQ